uniref:Uncharacterized protein n=1 Tax=Spongospora subterranea TaxID=70186 RepID=A0A0H5RC69_9EUKA|eukprot:CRZ06099.1 hypothetical protein [Spongospora subterranea]
MTIAIVIDIRLQLLPDQGDPRTRDQFQSYLRDVRHELRCLCNHQCGGTSNDSEVLQYFFIRSCFCFSPTIRSGNLPRFILTRFRCDKRWSHVLIFLKEVVIVVCRAHPSDCEVILAPPYDLHQAYEAIDWIDDRFDSVLVGTPVFARDPTPSYAASLSCLAKQKGLSHIYFLSALVDLPNCPQDFSSLMEDIVPVKLLSVKLDRNSSESWSSQETKLPSTLPKNTETFHTVQLPNDSGVLATEFRKMRGVLSSTTEIVIDLSHLSSNLRKEGGLILTLTSQPFLETLYFPHAVQACRCHGFSMEKIAPDLAIPALSIGSTYIPINDWRVRNSNVNISVTPFRALYLVAADDLCETKIIGKTFIAWSSNPTDLFKNLLRYLWRNSLCIILEYSGAECPLMNSKLMTRTRFVFAAASVTGSVHGVHFSTVRLDNAVLFFDYWVWLIHEHVESVGLRS